MMYLLIHGVMLTLAGVSIWWLWRRIVAESDRVVWYLVTLGLLIRALGGIALFWISWFGLPIAKSLQTGGGFWFFAPDAVRYYDAAVLAATGGLHEVVFIDQTLPSAFYSQALAAVIYLTGASPATALLLNVLAYLTTCLLFIRWCRRAGLERWTLLVALCGVSFFPSWILWSFQALKDTLFLTLMIAYVYVAAQWLDSPVSAPDFVRRNLLSIGLLILLVHAMASIRWYVAGVMIGATMLAWAAALIANRQQRPLRAAMALLFVAVVWLILPYSSGPSLPTFARQILRPAAAGTVAAFPVQAAEYLEEKRGDSLATVAQTMIQSPGARAGRNQLGATTGTAPVNESMLERLFPRAVAMFLPRPLGTALGWVEIQGGRGLLLLTDIDTVFMDLLLVALLWCMWRETRRGLALRPVFIVPALTTVLLAVAICYQTANFGTQFRFRSMVAVGFILLPMAFGRNPDVASGRS